MTVETTVGVPMDATILPKYFKKLINRFFKILPMKETGEDTLCTYMRSLQAELVGCRGFVITVREDGDLLSLVSILQYMIDNDNNPECDVKTVRREVFRCISICKALEQRYRCGAKGAV